ncbi:MAG: TetR/AcrR family transcriptional regulator [Planctomycetota bacterium]|nr:TetR/AcrR family transcriptional regulator [Planctomycetota bacterium]
MSRPTKNKSSQTRLSATEPTHRAPRQARSRQTLEKILDATERLLESRIFEDLTVQDILQEAGVSIGSFYARFKTKDDVLRDLYQRYREDLSSLNQEVIEKETNGLSLMELLEKIVRHTLQRMEKRRGLIRTIVLHMRQHPEASGDEERRVARRARHVGVELIVSRKNEISHPRPREAARMIIFTLAALGREFVLFDYTPHASQLKLSRERFIRETTRMMANYLGVK